MRATIRARLTRWYVAVLLLALVLFGGWVYLATARLRMGDLDQQLALTGAGVAADIAAELDEGGSLASAAREAPAEFSAPDRPIAVYDSKGALVTGIPAAVFEQLRLPGSDMATVTASGREWRLAVHHSFHRGVAYQVVAGESLARLNAENAALGRTLLVGIPLALALAAGGGLWIARRALRPVSQMVAQSSQVTRHTPGFRLRVPHPEDELGVLAKSFNSLLERLDDALSGQKRFMADASHELRTPLSIVRTAAEVSLSREGRSEADYREALGLIAEHARRLGRMVDDMLLLARVDADGLQLQAEPLYLDELIVACVRDASVLARARGVELRCAKAAETAFHGDQRLLRQLVMNLLDNAIRHTPSAGRVEARLDAQDGQVEIAVRDGGPGVPPSERERIFERFVRVDAARTRPGGAGLGLPIARCIAEAHGGSLELAESGPSGSTFRARLPVHAPSVTH